MKNNSAPEIDAKKVKTGHKKQNSRRTLNDVNELFRILPDDDTFTPENTKINKKQHNPKKTTNDIRKCNFNHFSKTLPDANVPVPKIIKKNEKEIINNSKTFYKKRDFNDCCPTTITPDKRVKEADKMSKLNKEDTKKHTQQNYKHDREEVVNKENLRKNNRCFGKEDIHRGERKQFNRLVRDEAKADVKNNSKLVADLKVNISNPIGDVLKTNNRKSYRDEKYSENRGGGDVGKQIKGSKLNENTKIDDKRIYYNIKEVPIVKPISDFINRKRLINDRYTIRLKNGPFKDNTAGNSANKLVVVNMYVM